MLCMVCTPLDTSIYCYTLFQLSSSCFVTVSSSRNGMWILWYWPQILRISLRNNRVCSCQFALQASCQGADGETRVNKVKSTGGAAYAKAKDSFSRHHHGARSSATLPHSGSAWRLRYAHRDVWREPVHALLGRYSYRAVCIWMHD